MRFNRRGLGAYINQETKSPSILCCHSINRQPPFRCNKQRRRSISMATTRPCRTGQATTSIILLCRMAVNNAGDEHSSRPAIKRPRTFPRLPNCYKRANCDGASRNRTCYVCPCICRRVIIFRMLAAGSQHKLCPAPPSLFFFSKLKDGTRFVERFCDPNHMRMTSPASESFVVHYDLHWHLPVVRSCARHNPDRGKLHALF